MTKAIVLALLLVSSVANAEGILNLGPNVGVSGGLTVNVSVLNSALSDAEELAQCRAQYNDALKSIKAAGFTILVARECTQTAASVPDQGFGFPRSTAGMIQFIR
jgi:hypothetical protein